jgi:probable F420-dependent oxidoreductase
VRIGIGVSEDLTLQRQAALAAEVEEAGFASLWTNEASGRDALLLCQAWAAATDGLEVGVGVAPIWTRTPAQLAMATATLQEASGGRFVLGLGVSHPATMGPWHGAEYRRPLVAARDTLIVLRAALAGETTDHDGEVLASRRFALAISPTPPHGHVLLAAMGPRMLQLAGEESDGTLLNWSSPPEVSRAGARVRAGAARAEDGKAPADVEVAAYVRVAVAEDAEVARLALAREISRYCALPAYAAHFTRQGFGAGVEETKEAYREVGAEAAAAAVPDRMLLALGWYGTPADDPAAMLARYDDAGLDHLVARVGVTDDDPVVSVRRTLAVLGAASR